MRSTKEDRSGREAEGGRGGGITWICRPGCGDRRWSGTRATARTLCEGTCRQWQCVRFCDDVGVLGQPGRSTVVLAARGIRRAHGVPVWTRTSGDRGRSATDRAGRLARSSDIAPRRGRCGALRLGGSGGDRTVAQPSRTRSDGNPAPDFGGRDFRRHSATSADRCPARSQRRTNALEHPRGTLRRAGSGGARSAVLPCGTVTPAWRPSWRILAPGMGS
jgi:hypothetical protein